MTRVNESSQTFANPAHRWANPFYMGRVIRHRLRFLARKLRWLTVFLWRTVLANRPVHSDLRPGRRGLERCVTVYINLASRLDRRASMEQLFSENSIESTRIEAILAVPGALGCAQSHVTALSSPVVRNSPIMVCEDDLVFTVPREEVDLTVEEFLRNPALDVLCLAYNLQSQPVPVSKRLQITDNTQTTACYVVKWHAVDALKLCFLESVDELMSGADPAIAAIDIAWKRLQVGKLIFAVPRARLAVQRPGFSDIVGSVVDYGV